jgi:sulfatase modifying factor 1
MTRAEEIEIDPSASSRVTELRHARERGAPEGMVWIPGGTFSMGSDHHYPEEAPAHEVSVDPFWLDRTPVTNELFQRFVSATGYVTLAERPANPADYPGAKPELLVASSVVFCKPRRRVDMTNPYEWWCYVPGADWRRPRGPGSSLVGVWDHPVVHIALEDARAYAEWAGKDLPTEAEWEFAARGGIAGAQYAWGDEFMLDGTFMANTWQGEFPLHNRTDDGYEWTSPVGAFPENAYGLSDMIGNVWEWTSDWYQEHRAAVQTCCPARNPRGGERERSFHADVGGMSIPRKVIKGGSFLCSPNYCRRYRPAARMAQAVDTSTCHVGFRCVLRP